MKTLFSIVIFIFHLTPLHSQLWKEYIDSAKFSKDQKRPEEAIAFYNKAKKALSVDSIFTDTYIQLSKNLADLYYSTAAYEDASLACRELMSSMKKIYTEMNGDYAWACNMLGAIYNNYGNLDTSRMMHLKAKDIREKLFGKKDRSYAQSCNNLAALYRDAGQFDVAEPLFLEAKAIRENIEPVRKTPQYAITCVALANLYRDMGQFGKAEVLYLEAKDIRSLAGKENADYANSCNILADLYYYMQQYEKAEALYLEAKDIRVKLDSGSYEYGQSCNNLATLYRDMGQYKKSETFALEAKKIYEKELPEGHGSLTINMNNLGEIYYGMGRYEESKFYLLRARQLWLKKLGKDHPYFIANSEGLARLYWNNKEIEKAAERYRESTQLKYEQLNKVFAFTSETEKQLYLKNINGSSDEYQSFYYQEVNHNNAGASYTLSLLHRNLILTSSRQTREIIYNSSDTTLIKIYKEWTGLKEQLAKLYSLGAAAKAELVKTFEEKANLLEKELSRRSAGFKKQQQKLGWKDIQRKLLPHEASIEFISFRLINNKRITDTVLYVALVLTKDNPFPVMVSLFNENDLVDLLASSGSSFEKLPDSKDAINKIYTSRVGILQNNIPTHQSMYELIWKPLEKQLQGIQTVYFAPSGLLHRVAFAALAVNKNEYLCDHYNLVQLTSTTAVADALPASISVTDKIKLYGSISYDADTNMLSRVNDDGQTTTKPLAYKAVDLGIKGNFKYLPGTVTEIEDIERQAKKAHIRVAAFSGMQASEESFKTMDAGSSPSVLHIASHGFFFPDPKEDKRDSIQRSFETRGKAFKRSGNPLLRSGLLFAGANLAWQGQSVESIEDGILTAYEVSNMYLSKTKLVVMSACETGLGDIEGSEGVYGLQRAFKMAGVQNIVMSLWKVPDQETAEFMQLFYKNMFAKKSIANSFYYAQKAMKNKCRDDAYKWAAWVMIR